MEPMEVPARVYRHVCKAIDKLQSKFSGFVSADRIAMQVKHQMRRNKEVPNLDEIVHQSLFDLTTMGVLACTGSSDFAMRHSITYSDHHLGAARSRPKIKAPGSQPIPARAQPMTRPRSRLDPFKPISTMVSSKKSVKRLTSSKSRPIQRATSHATSHPTSHATSRATLRVGSRGTSHGASRAKVLHHFLKCTVCTSAMMTFSQACELDKIREEQNEENAPIDQQEQENEQEQEQEREQEEQEQEEQEQEEQEQEEQEQEEQPEEQENERLFESLFSDERSQSVIYQELFGMMHAGQAPPTEAPEAGDEDSEEFEFN